MDAIGGKDIISWVLTALGLLFVFLYTKHRLDRQQRDSVIAMMRDYLVDIESLGTEMFLEAGSTPGQLRRWIEMNSKFKRLQGCVSALIRCPKSCDLTVEVLDLKRIATGGNAQSKNRPAALSLQDQRIVALSGSVDAIVGLLDREAERKFLFS